MGVPVKKNSNLSREFNIASFGGWSEAAPAEGFAGEPYEVELSPGTKVDRFGDELGRFVSPADVPFQDRSLPRGSERLEYNLYLVNFSTRVLAGPAASAFNMKGGGLQYRLSSSVAVLLQQGVLIKLEHRPPRIHENTSSTDPI